VECQGQQGFPREQTQASAFLDEKGGYHESVTVWGKSLPTGLDTATKLWLAEGYLSATSPKIARYAGQVVASDPIAAWRQPAYDPQDPMVQILGQVASTTQPWIDFGETYSRLVVATLGAEALYLAAQELHLAYAARLALDSRKLHTFVFRGNSYRLPHIQLTWWRRGIPGSASHIRIPLPKWFSEVTPSQKYF
jgi:hypothetical protein